MSVQDNINRIKNYTPTDSFRDLIHEKLVQGAVQGNRDDIIKVLGSTDEIVVLDGQGTTINTENLVYAVDGKLYTYTGVNPTWVDNNGGNVDSNWIDASLKYQAREKLEKGGYIGTAQDLKDGIDLAYKVINFPDPTGTVALQTDYPIGQRVLVRKLNATQGTVTISCAGHTFTRTGLNSVALNSDGDFWELEKVSDTRWELIKGQETGFGIGEYIRSADGVQICSGSVTKDFGSFISDAGSGLKLATNESVVFYFQKEFESGYIPFMSYSSSKFFVVGSGTVPTESNSSAIFLAIDGDGTYAEAGIVRLSYTAYRRWY